MKATRGVLRHLSDHLDLNWQVFISNHLEYWTLLNIRFYKISDYRYIIYHEDIITIHTHTHSDCSLRPHHLRRNSDQWTRIAIRRHPTVRLGCLVWCQSLRIGWQVYPRQTGLAQSDLHPCAIKHQINRQCHLVTHTHSHLPHLQHSTYLLLSRLQTKGRYLG